MEFLLGLDMLKRYQAAIDLKSNQLHMWAGETCVSVSFLSEGQLPESKGGTRGLSAAMNESQKTGKDGGNDKKPSAS